jgi:hypothetical protein
MSQDLRGELELCVLNHGHIMLSYTYVEELLRYIKGLEDSKNTLNQKISELYGLIDHRDQIINESIRFKNVHNPNQN